jgi:hypothetical protein
MLGRQNVAADGSRRTHFAAKTAPTAVGGYLSMEYPSQVGSTNELPRTLLPRPTPPNGSRPITFPSGGFPRHFCMLHSASCFRLGWLWGCNHLPSRWLAGGYVHHSYTIRTRSVHHLYTIPLRLLRRCGQPEDGYGRHWLEFQRSPFFLLSSFHAGVGVACPALLRSALFA